MTTATQSSLLVTAPQEPLTLQEKVVSREANAEVKLAAIDTVMADYNAATLSVSSASAAAASPTASSLAAADSTPPAASPPQTEAEKIAAGQAHAAALLQVMTGQAFDPYACPAYMALATQVLTAKAKFNAMWIYEANTIDPDNPDHSDAVMLTACEYALMELYGY